MAYTFGNNNSLGYNNNVQVYHFLLNSNTRTMMLSTVNSIVIANISAT
ncbi:hypothetical protein B7R74_11820 [Yersinia pseudotuberculosis]|nr:hypothetical protein B7R74_11820 [Yersinia pseudotuberculosis]